MTCIDGIASGLPRSRAQRRRDTEQRLAADVDVWVASASSADSPTGRNLAASGTVRLGLGETRDLTMIDGEVDVLELDALPRIQAWREADELPGRELMRDGRWLGTR